MAGDWLELPWVAASDLATMSGPVSHFWKGVFWKGVRSNMLKVPSFQVRYFASPAC